MCICMSVRGDRAQGRTYPHPGSIFFRNSHFSESLLPLKRHRGEPTHTHGTHGRTRAHESHRTQKNLSPHKTTTQEPSKLTNTPARPHDRTTARRPNPRPIQQPQPRSRTLPTADYRSVRSRLPRSLFTGTVPVLSRVCPPGSPRCLYRAWLLSRPRFRPSRGRAGVSLGLDGCEVDRLCDPCARMCARVPVCAPVCPVCVPCVSRLVCVPCVSRLPPVSFYRYVLTIDKKRARPVPASSPRATGSTPTPSPNRRRRLATRCRNQSTGALAASFMTILRLLGPRAPDAPPRRHRQHAIRRGPRIPPQLPHAPRCQHASFMQHLHRHPSRRDAQTILNAARARMLRVSYGVV